MFLFGIIRQYANTVITLILLILPIIFITYFPRPHTQLNITAIGNYRFVRINIFGYSETHFGGIKRLACFISGLKIVIV